MGEGFGVDFFGEGEAVAVRLGEADELLKPGGTGGLEVNAGVEGFHCAVNGGVDGELIAAGVNAEFEV